MNFLGDFSRWTFDPRKHFTRVLPQQGHALMDADALEESAIFWHYLRALAEDIGGPHWAPATAPGFRVELPSGGEPDLVVHPGIYYVRGARCENPRRLRYVDQPGAAQLALRPGRHLVYLEVWERHVSQIEDPSIREVALGGADTAVRAALAWQVRVQPDWPHDPAATRSMSHDALIAALFDREHRSRSRLEARVAGEEPAEDPCEPPPVSGYQGPENQLYRVEIHRGGPADQATFKWSRDNAVSFAVEQRQGALLTLAHLGRDPSLSLNPGDWVEVLDDRTEHLAGTRPLLQVMDVDRDRYRVTLSGEPAAGVGTSPEAHPRLRRWDHRAGRPDEGGAELADGALRVREGAGETAWIELEDGIRVRFRPPPEGRATAYRGGDYWWIPARTATGNIEWPTASDGQPLALEPHGVDRVHAPLAVIEVPEEGSAALHDTRWILEPPRITAEGRG